MSLQSFVMTRLPSHFSHSQANEDLAASRNPAPPRTRVPVPVAIRAAADLHCHLLPAWDDGARDLEESLAMAVRAALFGLEAIVVTPHVGRSLNIATRHEAHEIPAAVTRLQEVLRARGLLLDLIPGAEVSLGTPDIVERIATERAFTLGGMGRYALVEPPFSDWPDWADVLLSRLAQSGVTPIIAHPERFPVIQNDPELLRWVCSTGALLQITARNVVGKGSRASRLCAHRLLKAGMVALVASDAHGVDAVLPSEVEAELRSVVGDQAALQILVENPRRVLRGEAAIAPRVT